MKIWIGCALLAMSLGRCAPTAPDAGVGAGTDPQRTVRDAGRACGPSRWNGACARSGDVCDRGECVAPCGPSRPTGGCEVGVCRDGRCVSECPSIAFPHDDCAACTWDVFDAGRCEVPDRCRDCVDCVGARPGPGARFGRTCGCLERAACAGCETIATDYWRCVLDACPRCVE